MPKNEDTGPTTLSQRRGTTPTLSSGILSNNNSAPTNLRAIAQGQQSEDDNAVVKIVIWGVIILAAGIGLAFLVRNMTKNESTQTAQTTDTDQISQVVEEEEEEEVVIEEEPIVEEEEVVEEEPVAPTTPTTPVATGGLNLTNEYSKLAQTINDGVTTAVATISGYSYETSSTRFMYTIKLAGDTKFPTTSATLDTTANTLTVVVDNVSRDNIVGNGGSGSTTFASAVNAESVSISNSGGKSTFVFKLKKSTEYKINAVSTDGSKITVEIKHN